MGEISNLIKQATRDPEHGAPGIVFQAIDRNGKVLNSTASGVRGLDDKHPMTMDTTFWIASCTKMVTSIALMQLVEQGKADLDSADQLEKVVPEMREVKIIEGVDENGKPKLREKKNRITLRMLQTHIAGFSYTFFSEDIWRSIEKNPEHDEFQGSFEAIKQPLIFEPGTSRAYGINIDWVGVFVERVSGLKLGDYFQKNIFEPLGIKNTAFVTKGEMRSRMAGMHQRDEQGNLTPRSHPFKPARQDMKTDETFHSGGGGLLSTAPDYCQILAAMLNDGVSPTTKARILEKKTIDQMFTPQIPDWESKYAAAGYPVSRTDLAAAFLRDGLPVTGKQGWGLNFLLEGDRLQRGSAPGLSNCFWEMDREKGIAGIMLSQILPFGDPVVFPLWMQIQPKMYE